MDNIIGIPKTQAITAFVATCIEATARRSGTSYVFMRMKEVGMKERDIVPRYEGLSTESREHIGEGMKMYKVKRI